MYLTEFASIILMTRIYLIKFSLTLKLPLIRTFANPHEQTFREKFEEYIGSCVTVLDTSFRLFTRGQLFQWNKIFSNVEPSKLIEFLFTIVRLSIIVAVTV